MSSSSRTEKCGCSDGARHRERATLETADMQPQSLLGVTPIYLTGLFLYVRCLINLDFYLDYWT